jgi:hypothetical protein
MKAGRLVYSDDAFDAEYYDPIAKKLRMAAKGRKGRRGKRDDSSSSEEDSSGSESDDESSSSESESEDDVRARKGKKEKEKKAGRREVRTRKVVVAENEKRKGNNDLDEVEQLIGRLHGMQRSDASYAGAYARLVCVAPTIAERIPAPTFWYHQMPTPTTWKQPAQITTNAVSTPLPLPVPQQVVGIQPQAIIPTPRTSFTTQHPSRRQWPARTDEPCFFCKDPNHILRGCPTAAAYISGEGRQASVDWDVGVPGYVTD